MILSLYTGHAVCSSWPIQLCASILAFNFGRVTCCRSRCVVVAPSHYIWMPGYYKRTCVAAISLIVLFYTTSVIILWLNIVHFLNSYNIYNNTITNHQYTALFITTATFILVFNQLDAQNLFYSKFYFTPLHVSSTCAHHQEIKIALYSLWYHHTYRWPGRPPICVM